MRMLDKYVARILRARVYDVAVESPLEPAKHLSRLLRNHIYMKREDLQPVFSFKLRGAYNKISQLTDAERQAGIIAASAGNHAQGVALAAHQLHLAALIVMPRTTPEIKINAVRRLGADTLLFGDSYDEAYQEAHQIALQRGLTFIHPYDDPDVIAGQGTVAVELVRQFQHPIDAVFVPVGGGGLIAGIAAYLKFVRPNTRVIGVEPEDSDCLNQALKAGRRVTLKQVGLFADGVAVKQIGKEPFHIAQHHVDEVITVSTDEICAATKDLFDETRSIAEPAGALAMAGLKKYVETNQPENQHLIAITSGANINFDRLRHMAERTLLGEHRELLMAVTIPEQPGSFLNFCEALGQRNITEFNYRYAQATQAHIFVGVQIERHEAELLMASLRKKGYDVTDMTTNELAIEHMRFMVGGHAPNIVDELVYRFEFPERPGALLAFLTALSGRWNISLFHYRNHGSAFGRVLMGMQVPSRDRARFKSFLKEAGIAFQEETQNPAYALFAGDKSL